MNKPEPNESEDEERRELNDPGSTSHDGHGDAGRPPKKPSNKQDGISEDQLSNRNIGTQTESEKAASPL